MSDSWEFIVVRLRDDYNTVVTVPKSEYPTEKSAWLRVESEFPLELWRIGLAPDSNQESEPKP